MQAKGYVTVEQVEKEFLWSTGRAIDALETLLKVNTASGFSLYDSNLHGSFLRQKERKSALFSTPSSEKICPSNGCI